MKPMRLLIASLSLFAASACSATDEPNRAGGGGCNAGVLYQCACPNGTFGSAQCSADGASFTPCVCAGANPAGTPLCNAGAAYSCACSGGTTGNAICAADGLSFGACQCAPGAEPVGTVPPVGTEPPPATSPSGTETAPVGTDPPVVTDPPIALDECGLATGYDGDQYCILPPPIDQGFQVHYGPFDYDNPVDVNTYILAAGGESNQYVPAVSGNTTSIYFYRRQYRMRPGSHHLIVSEAGGAGGFVGTARRLGGSQNVVKDNPTGPTPPENVGIGMPLAANAALSLNLHHFNGTGGPILREAWINFWYVDPATVTQEAREMFLFSPGSSVLPGQTATHRGTVDVPSQGRVLTMYGHRHSNAVRFSAWRTRGTSRELVYEDYNWLEPAVFEFNSLTTNPVPNPTAYTSGGHTGLLDILPGDRLEWECEVVNNRAYTISYGANEAEDSEMCILIGDNVGPTLRAFFGL